MAGTTLYLIRSSNLTYAKQEGVTDVFLSGSPTAYTSVTGVASTDTLTITGATLADGMAITLTSLTGGAGFTTGVGYYAVSSSGATCKLATTPGGAAIDFTTNITAGSAIVQAAPMQVWSTEYRDIFSYSSSVFPAEGSITVTPTGGGVQIDSTASSAVIMQAALVPTTLTAETVSGGYSSFGSLTTNTLTKGLVAASVNAEPSDEVAHTPLRQTLLNRSFWIFDRGANATPRYLPAEYQEGDIIATSPPNTP